MKSSILNHLLVILAFASLSLGMAVALNSSGTTSPSSLNSLLLEDLSNTPAGSVDLAKGWCYSQRCRLQHLTKVDDLEIIAIALGIVLGVPLFAISLFCVCLCWVSLFGE